ncbi:phage protein [Providencia rettgeri Dmel1]|nr:phage protein [Providencia rettgeri Dmel1]
MTKIFKIPFATQGDRTSIPDDVQADGAVSYTQGYSYDYERDQQTDPAAKDIEREKMNGIFHDITEAVGELQSFGFPKWAAEGKPYPIRAIIYHKNKTWQSKIENNNVEPVAGTAWQELKADLSAGDINVYNKTESDKRFQPLGNYALKGESYTKVEGDARYQAKGSYQPSGDYATNTALNNGLDTKLNTSSVVQATGASTTNVMSQKSRH